MAYVHNPNHVEEAVALIHDQHKEDEDLKNWIRALLRPLQTLEDALQGLYTAFDLDNIIASLIEYVTTNQDEIVFALNGEPVWTGSSSGQTDRLSRVGGVLGEPRNGRLDREYLAYVIARTLINRSNGDAEFLYAVARAILGPTNNTLRLEGAYPAGYRMFVGGNQIAFPWDVTVAPDFVASVLADLLLEATYGGVGLELWYQASDDAHTFTFAPGEDSVTDANMGFADATGLVGGQFIGVEFRP